MTNLCKLLSHIVSMSMKIVDLLFSENYLGRFKTICCIPIFALVVLILLCFIAGIGLFVHYRITDKYANGFMISFACIFGLSLLSNIHNFGKAMIALIVPQKRRIMKAVDTVHRLKLDGFMQVLKREVTLMNNLVRMVDRFTKNTTRLVVVVDGLDTCEQEKVLQVLDIIHSLFNEENSSFVVVLAVDPQIIIKGIDQNLKTAFHDTNVNGFDYLRNIVHLPFYLQSQGIQVKKQDFTKSVSSYDVNHESPTHNHKNYRVSKICIFFFSISFISQFGEMCCWRNSDLTWVVIKYILLWNKFRKFLFYFLSEFHKSHKSIFITSFLPTYSF